MMACVAMEGWWGLVEAVSREKGRQGGRMASLLSRLKLPDLVLINSESVRQYRSVEYGGLLLG